MSNQTIDGAPRELLELCAQCLDNSGYAAAHGELRALLAKPAEQHQGEPVGYKYRRKSKNRAWTYSANRPEFAEEEFEILPLYTRPAEQPALVAVVLPEREMFHGEMDVPEVAFNKGWNACLDEVARLNPPQQ